MATIDDAANARALISCSIGKQEMLIHKALSDDRRTEFERKCSELVVQLSRLKREKKEINKDFKNRIDPVEAELAHVAHSIDLNFEDVTEMVHIVPDEDNLKMLFITDYGEIVHSRPMDSEERRQYRIPLRTEVTAALSKAN